MPIPRIAYALLLATTLALPIHAAAPPVPKDEEETKLTPDEQARLVLLATMLHNIGRDIELPVGPDQGPNVSVTPQETDPITPGGPTEPTVTPQETPEPAALGLALVASGTGIAAWLRRRRKTAEPVEA